MYDQIHFKMPITFEDEILCMRLDDASSKFDQTKIRLRIISNMDLKPLFIKVWVNLVHFVCCTFEVSMNRN